MTATIHRSRGASASELGSPNGKRSSLREAISRSPLKKWASGTRMIPKSGLPVFGQRSCATKKRGWSAERRIQPWPCFTQTSVRSLRHSFREGTAAIRAGIARLPAPHCGACPGERTPELSPGRASRELKRDTQALPAPSFALKRSTPRPGHDAGGDDARTARERGHKPRPQEPHSLRVQVCLEATPLTSEIL
jgi:hypothetical protein